MATRMLRRLGGALATTSARLATSTNGVAARQLSALCGPLGRSHAVPVVWSGTPVRHYHQSELEEEFEEKVEELRELDRTQFTLTMNIQLDAHYNQAVRGPCADDATMMSSMSKTRGLLLETWRGLEDMESDVAMATFIELVNSAQSFPGSIDAKEQKDMNLFEEEQVAFAMYGAEDLAVSVQDHIQTIRFNRPSRRNALTLKMYHDVVDALADAAEDDNVHLTVFTGSGEFYCSGNDLSNFDLANTTLAELVKGARSTLEKFVAAFIDHPKPLVAAVNGPAVGIAVTTLGLCDIVLASSEATFHTPFTSLGQSPEGCSSYLFPKIMGPAKANDVLLLGYKLTATEAMQYRLATRVLLADVFERDYLKIANWMASLPQESLRLSRNLIRSYDIEKLHEANRLECDLLEKRWVSPECHKALQDFAQRHQRKLKKRLDLLEGRDSRVVQDREDQLRKELEQHEQTQAQLPEPAEAVDQLESGHVSSNDAQHQLTEGTDSAENPETKTPESSWRGPTWRG